MSNEKNTRERYRHLRDEFDGLKIEDKALFLVEAAASTVARGVEDAGRSLARELDDLFERARASSEEREPRSHGHEAAQPSSSERQAPHPPYRPPADDVRMEDDEDSDV